VSHHSHQDAVELFYGLEGICSFSLTSDGEDIETIQKVGEGDLLTINPRTSHKIINESPDVACKMLVISLNRQE